MEIARKAAVNNVRDILKNTAIPPLPRGSEAEIGPHVTGALPPSHGSQPTAAPSRKIVPDAGDRCETVHTKLKKSDQASPFAPAPLQSLRRYYGLLRPCAPLRYSRPRGWSRLRLVPSRRRRDEAQVLTFYTKAWSSFAPPTCRMPLGHYQGIPEPDTPQFVGS